MTLTPAFSIVIPTYQRRDMVCEAVSALSRLEYAGAFDVILVVNGSTDGTAAALARLDGACPIRIIELQPNRGPAAARNRGAREATGEILLFLDDDLLAEPKLLQHHAKFHAEGADVVTGEILTHAESKPGFITDRLLKAAGQKREAKGAAFDLYSGHFSIRNRLFQQVGGFDEEFGTNGRFGGDDVDLGIRLSEFDLRHNSDAVVWQKSLITPLQHMRRARQLAASDLRLLVKHPEIRDELLWHRGAADAERPPAFRLSRIPLLAPIAAVTMSWLAELAQRTPFRSSPKLANLYFTARAMSYWSAFRTPAGKAILKAQKRH